MVCGYVSASGVGDHRKILIHHPVQYVKYLTGNNLIVQHGCEPKHTDNAVKTNRDIMIHYQPLIGLPIEAV